MTVIDLAAVDRRRCWCDCSAPFTTCPCERGACTCGLPECWNCMAARADGGRAPAAVAAGALLNEALALAVEAERALMMAARPDPVHVERVAVAVRYLTQARHALGARPAPPKETAP